MPESMSFGDAGQPQGRQRILVLGASGFIGRRVLQMLATGDWAAPVGASRRTVHGTHHGVEMLTLDATRGTELQAALRGAAGIVNCVAGDAKDIVAGARALFDAASRMARAPRIVHLSTMMVYGTAVGEVDESAALKGDWDDYSAAKAEVERLSRSYARVVNLRPGIVYGPHSPIWSGWVGQWLRQRRIGDLGTAGLGYCNLVHVDDVVEAVSRALLLPGIEGEAFNLSLSSPPTWNDYFCKYAQALGVAARPISHTRLMMERYLLAPPLKIAQLAARYAPSGSFASFDPPQPIRPWFLRLCGHAQRLDVRKAERDLGMKWMPLEQGLRETAAWLTAGDESRSRSRGAS
jgi:nucleoside-diphosphate-sugar epimerase